jgi:hypothetical protein
MYAWTEDAMVAATTNRGLSAADLTSIRTTLETGRKPKVVFTDAAGQIAGQFGQVVDLLDPKTDEWVVVRFGRDELPFSPADLAIPPRGPAKRAAKPEAPTPPPPDNSAPDLPYESLAAVPPQRQEVSTMSIGSTVDSEVPDQPAADATDDAKPARKAAARQPKVKAPPSLTVTISYVEGEWLVGAQQGTKALAKPYLIKPAEALRMVALLDVPGVHEAVEQIVEAERADTQAQAERLRSQLAEIEARLAELPAAL